MLEPKDVAKVVSSYAPYLRHNYDLIQILEGNLLPYVDEALRCQLSMQSYAQAKHRAMPINILSKVIDKLTNIYQTTVIRRVEDGTDADQELVDWYVKETRTDRMLDSSNELYNLCKGSLIYPSVYKGKPSFRAIQNDRYIVLANDPAQPQTPTDVIILAGQKNGKDVYWCWDESTFQVIVGDEVDRFEMLRMGNPEGINPFGRLPFVYAVDSKFQVMPVQDTSTIKVAVTVPVMLSDLNLAAMFQTFSIIYGIDLDDEGIKFAPNAVWKFRSDPVSQQKPEIGQIKPQVDIDQVIRLIDSELSMWLSTKGIRPGTIGQLGADNVASGISKVIDEMDTYESRQHQVTVFTEMEADLWDLTLKVMHPYWVSTGQISNRQLFTQTAEVCTTFAVQLPQQQRGAVVADLKAEVEAGFTTRERAIQALNPEMTADQVKELLDEIEGVAEENSNGATRPEGNTSQSGDPGQSNQEPADQAS